MKQHQMYWVEMGNSFITALKHQELSILEQCSEERANIGLGEQIGPFPSHPIP